MAGNINVVCLDGRLTDDPELRYTSSGTAVCDLSIAVNRYYRDKNDEQVEETSFFDVTAWGNTAEQCDQYLSRGQQVIIQGRLKQDRWESENGDSRSKVKIVAENVQFGGGGNSGKGGTSGQSKGQQGAPGPSSSPSGGGQQVNDRSEGDDEDDYSDIPF